MNTRLFDLSQQPLPLRLLRVRQLRSREIEPLLEADFAPDLEYPTTSESERGASAERLLYARRRSAN
jgi:hypothetical protein